MVTLLVFTMAFFGGSFWPEKKNCWTQKVHLMVMFSKIWLDIQCIFNTTYHVNFLLFDNDDMRPLKCQVSFILSIFVLI